MSNIPEENWLKIFSYLDPSDLYSAALVCYHWSQLIGNSESLWKIQCLSLSNPHIKQQILTDKNVDQKPWKEVFQNNYGHKLVKRQWMEGCFSNIQRLDDLPAKVMCPMDVDTWGDIFERELKR